MSKKLDIKLNMTKEGFADELTESDADLFEDLLAIIKQLEEQQIYKADLELQLAQIRRLLYIVIGLVWVGFIFTIWVS